ncbi:ATP-binding cassette domain-containing protein, partial [Anaerotignum faecicola]
MSIQLNHLTHVYNEGTTFEKVALNDVTLEIQTGEFIGLIGHTGSGKSTLIQHLNGIISPSSGEI